MRPVFSQKRRQIRILEKLFWDGLKNRRQVDADAQGWMVVDTEMPPFISEAHIPPLGGSISCWWLNNLSLFRNWLLSQVAASLIPQEQPISNDCLMKVYKSLDPLCFNSRCLWSSDHATCGSDWSLCCKWFTVQNFPLPSPPSLTLYCALPEHPS